MQHMGTILVLIDDSDAVWLGPNGYAKSNECLNE